LFDPSPSILLGAYWVAAKRHRINPLYRRDAVEIAIGGQHELHAGGFHGGNVDGVEPVVAGDDGGVQAAVGSAG